MAYLNYTEKTCKLQPIFLLCSEYGIHCDMYWPIWKFSGDTQCVQNVWENMLATLS